MSGDELTHVELSFNSSGGGKVWNKAKTHQSDFNKYINKYVDNYKNLQIESKKSKYS